MEFLTLKPTFILFFVIFVAIVTGTLAARSSSAIWFIQKTCKKTPHPPLCESSSLIFSTSKTKATHKDLCKSALISALAAAQNTTAGISKLRRKHRSSLSPYEAEAMADCFKNLRDSIEELRRASNAFKSLNGTNSSDQEFLMSSVKTWLSAAETDVNTCIDGFDSSRKGSSPVKRAVKKTVVKVLKLISNALYLVNNWKLKP